MNFVKDFLRDPEYILELNLQRIRRELIYLLDASEANECFVCNKLKCCCVDPYSGNSSTLSVLTPSLSGPSSTYSIFSLYSTSSNNSFEDFFNPVAPPAHSLPRPEFLNRGVDDWVRASTSTPNFDPYNEPNQDANVSRNIFNIYKNVEASTSKDLNPSKNQEDLADPVKMRDDPPNLSLGIKVEIANSYISLQPETSNINRPIGILSKSTPNISQEPSKVIQKPKASQDGKGPKKGNAWPKTVWNEWNQLDNGLRWPGDQQRNTESVEAFFRSFSALASNSSVGYSSFKDDQYGLYNLF